MLGSTNREIVIAAGEALSQNPAHLAPLVDAARSNPDLFAPASRALGAHDATADGLATLLTLPAPDNGADLADAVSRMARRLAPDQLLLAARAIERRPLRVAALAHVPTPDFMTNPVEADARRELLELLLGTRLDADEPEAALQILTALQDDIETAPFARQRVAALLRLGRIDDASGIDGVETVPAEVWLDALSACRAEPFAGELARAIRERFADRLTEEEARRLEEAAAPLDPPAADRSGARDAVRETVGQAREPGAPVSPAFR
jgi:hypothetical protein